MICDLYVGVGIKIDPFDLAARLDIDLTEESEPINAKYFCCRELKKYFKKNPITLSESVNFISILSHPYCGKAYKWDNDDVVIGVFDKIGCTYAMDGYNMMKLKYLLDKFSSNAKIFKKKFGKNPCIMIIRNEDDALSSGSESESESES